MDKDQETFDTWNKVASMYQSKFMDMQYYNETYDYFLNTAGPGPLRILDVGCGPGNIARYLLQARPDTDLLGIDIALNMIELARKNNPTARFEVMDTRDIDQIDTVFDGIIAGFCIPYLSHEACRDFVHNAFKLLSENGIVYISFVEGEPSLSDYKVSSVGRVFFNYHRLEDILSLLSQARFVELVVFKVDYPISDTDSEQHTIVVGRK